MDDLQGLLAQFQPTDEDRKRARQQALMAASLSLLGRPKGAEYQSLGQAGLLGMGLYNQALGSIPQQRLEAAKAGMGLQELMLKQRAMQQDEAARKVTSDFLSNQNGSGTSQAPIAAATGGGSPKSMLADKYEALSQELMRRGYPEQAQKYMDISSKLRPKLKDTKTLTRGGERVTVNLYDDGSTEVLPYGADKEKAVQVNTGSQIIAADPYNLQPLPGGAAFDKTMTPGEVASNQIAQGQLAVSQGNLSVAQGNAATSRGQLAETTRHNQATEGNAATTLAKQAEKEQKMNRGQVDMADRVLGMVDQALPEVGMTTTGFGGAALGIVPGTPAYNLKAKIDSIKANLGFEQLQAMRNSSPTGGALGNVSEMEIKFLQSSVANLDTAQSPKEMRDALMQVQKHLRNVKALIQQGQAQGATPTAAPTGGKSVVRTGTYNGRRVVQYSDGTTEYAQ